MPDTTQRDALLAYASEAWVEHRPSLEARYSRRAVDLLIRHGVLTHMGRGWIAPTMHAPSLDVIARAALACTGQAGIVTGAAALFLRGAAYEAPTRVLVTVTRHHHVLALPPGARLYRSDHVPDFDTVDGLRLARAPWSLAHAMREVPRERRRGLALSLLSGGAIRVADAAEVLDSHPQMEGAVQLRAALGAFAQGAQSPIEDTAHRRILTGRLARMRRQVDMVVGGRRVRLDAYDDASRVAVEFDGALHHAHPEQWRRDRERDALLAAVGILTVRFAGHDVQSRPRWCREVLERVVRGRESQVAPMQVPTARRRNVRKLTAVAGGGRVSGPQVTAVGGG